MPAHGAPAHPVRVRRRPLAGVGILTRSGVRQNVWFMLPWIAFVALLTVASYAAYDGVFPDAKARAAFEAAVASNPAFTLLLGPAVSLSDATGFTVWRTFTLGCITAAMMSVLLVTRLTRAAEETGRAELMAASPVGRSSRLGSALAIAVLANALFALVTGGLLAASGMTPSAAWLLGASYGFAGLVFAGISAVAAQIGAYSRTANAIGLSTLGALYLIRGFADSTPGGEWLRWFSPFGWLQWVNPLGDSAGPAINAGPLLLAGILSLLLWAGAFWLSANRDFGTGLLPQQPGPTSWHISRGGAAFALAFRLQRSSIITWAVAFVVLSGVFGMITSTMGDLFAQDPTLAQMFAAGAATPGAMTAAYVVTLISLLSIIVTAFGIQSALRLWGEEADDRVELALSASLSRWRLFASHAVIALVAPAAILLAGSLLVGITATLTNATDGALTTMDALFQGVLTLPALWVITGLTLALVGVEPRFRAFGWVALVAEFTITLLGPLLNLPDWTLRLSPLYWVPSVTSSSPDYGPSLLLALGAGLLIGVGALAYRRRDIR
jgi:ABC-2 type transport system permease protein